MVEDQQAVDVADAPQVGGEAGGVLPRQVTQEAEAAHQSVQEAGGRLAERRAQRLWRRDGERTGT